MAMLGFGVGYRPVHFSDFVAAGSNHGIDWIEIISENFMGIGGKPKQRLDWLLQHYPVAMHGVSLSIASTDPLDPAYLTALRELADYVNPPVVSDHLCWTKTRNRQLHDLLPFPYTSVNFAHVAGRIDEVQQRLGRRLSIENPSAYVAFHQDEMSEAEFLAALAQKTGCGILLDINNLFVNQCNLGYDPHLYFELLSPDMVTQFHLAGHAISDKLRIDTHDQPVCDEVWSLFRQAAQRYPEASAMIEWDDQIPSFARLKKEVQTMREVHSQAISIQPVSSVASRAQKHTKTDCELFQFQETFARHMVVGDDAATANLLEWARPTPGTAAAGLSVYQQAYFLRVHDALKESFPTLFYIVEDAGFHRLIADYLLAVPLTHYSLDQAGSRLPSFLRSAGVTFYSGASPKLLADLAELDWAMAQAFMAPDEEVSCLADFGKLKPAEWEGLRLKFAPSASLLRLASDPTEVWRAAQSEASSAPPPSHVQTNLLVYREHGNPVFVPLDNFAAEIMHAFSVGQTFSAICADLVPDEEQLPNVVAHIADWAGRNIVFAQDLHST